VNDIATFIPEPTLSKARRAARNEALEDAARVVESAHMPRGDGPVMLFEIKAEMAKAIRRLVR
jgi:hypothetical protein